MKSYWLSCQKSDTLLIFCNGWGMDYHPFLAISPGELDVLMFYDYRRLELPDDFHHTLEGYRCCHLLCWSMGVWAGQQLFSPIREKFSRRIALNGTLMPIDDQFGIPPEVYDATLEGFSADNQRRFYRRMCREKGVLSSFLDSCPQRSMDDQKQELAALKAMIAGCRNTVDKSIFTDVIISGNDLVMPTAHQEAFWDLPPVTLVNGCHFPFLRWQSWQEILTLVAPHG